jgi:hypothetical protein
MNMWVQDPPVGCAFRGDNGVMVMQNGSDVIMGKQNGSDVIRNTDVREQTFHRASKKFAST